MTMLKNSRLRATSICIMVSGVIGLLAACGKDNSASAALATAPEAAQAKLAKPCFLPVGQLGEKDAKVFAAAGSGDVLRLQQAIDAGGNVNAIDSLRRTPLFAAAFCNQTQVASLLIDRGSIADAKDFTGSSPLHTAVITGSDEVVKALLLKGANINIQDAMGYTPLHLAAATDQVGIVELLLEHGANVRISGKNELTAAALALRNGHPKAVAAIKRSQ